MNIFLLDWSPNLCAQYYTDGHLKQVTNDTLKILSVVHRLSDGKLTVRQQYDGSEKKYWRMKDANREAVMYDPTNLNDPYVKWAGKSKQNYLYLYSLLVAFGEEYVYRFGKTHKAFRKDGEWANLTEYLSKPPESIPSIGLTEPPLVMPAEYKI
jgi:hypothetical protein